MELSVVIPVFNEEKRIWKTLSRLSGYLKRHFSSWEIIVVDDGSSDRTKEILSTAAERVRVIRNETNHGKGSAVRQGILAAEGEWIFFTDADLSTPTLEIGKFVELFRARDAEVLIGSRSIPGSVIKIRQACYRQNMGRIFNWFVKRLTPLRFQDTQCGFKGFTREAARKIFSCATKNGFAFDVEILLLARNFAFKVKEVPVTWVNNSKSKVRPITDSARMFRELLEVRNIDLKQEGE